MTVSAEISVKKGLKKAHLVNVSKGNFQNFLKKNFEKLNFFGLRFYLFFSSIDPGGQSKIRRLNKTAHLRHYPDRTGQFSGDNRHLCGVLRHSNKTPGDRNIQVRCSFLFTVFYDTFCKKIVNTPKRMYLRQLELIQYQLEYVK